MKAFFFINRKGLFQKLLTVMCPVDHIDHAGWHASLLAQLHQDHGGSRVTLGWLHHGGVATHGSHGEHLGEIVDSYLLVAKMF